jgi:toxin YoeB
MNILFHQSALIDYQQWAVNDVSTFKKINDLIKEITRTPFVGTGKPEPLRGNLAGFWSRHITGKHRLVYRVEQELLIIAACKSHFLDSSSGFAETARIAMTAQRLIPTDLSPINVF